MSQDRTPIAYRHHGIARYTIAMAAAAVAFSCVSFSPAHAQNAPSPNAKWSDILAAAKKEKKITLYASVNPPVIDRIVAGFKKAYPEIDVEQQRLTSGLATSRVDQEKANGLDGADVIINSEKLWFLGHAKANSLLKPVGPAASAWPTEYLVEGSVIVPGIGPIGIPYSTTQVKTPPQDFGDLLKPEFKDKIGIAALVATFSVAWYDWVEKQQGSDYFAKLKAQNPKTYSGSTTISQAISAGEIAIGNFGDASAITTLIEQGAPIAYVVPKGALGYQFYAGALGWAKRPNAALVFIDYIMSREGQTIWHSKKDSASPLPDIPGSLDPKSIKVWNPEDYPPEVSAKITERWNSIFKK